MFVLPTPAHGASQTSQSQDFEQVRALMQDLVHGEGVPSLAVGVAMDGRIVWEEGFGWADRERGVEATSATPYSLASLTKPITATGVLLLAERKALDLDAPIEEQMGRPTLTGFAGDTRDVTPRSLMAHSAGLPRHYYFYHGEHAPPSAEETIARYGILVYPPGRRFEYSNLGYRALDLAITRASGKTYGNFIRSEIFLPLGMTRSALGVDPGWRSEAATRYADDQSPIPFYMTDHPGSGDVWASVHDVLRFAMLHLDTRMPGQEAVLTAEAVEEMQRVQSPPDSPFLWGLGWEVGTHRGHRVIRHGGNQPGVHNQLVLYPDLGIALVVLANQNHPRVREVLEEMAGAVVEPAQDHATRDSVDALRGKPEPFPELSGTWRGEVTTYEGPQPFLLKFQPDGDVHAQVGSRMTSLVNYLDTSGGALQGWFYGVKDTGDSRRHPHVLFLSLVRDGEQLVGQLVAETTLVNPGYFALASFVRLEPDGDGARTRQP